jgi:hypothetical protein
MKWDCCEVCYSVLHSALSLFKLLTVVFGLRQPRSFEVQPRFLLKLMRMNFIFRCTCIRQKMVIFASSFSVHLGANSIFVRPRNAAIYQYAVHFQPQIDSRNMRFRLLNEQRATIGPVKAFDGNILFLPKQLQHKVRNLISWYCFRLNWSNEWGTCKTKPPRGAASGRPNSLFSNVVFS